MMVRSVKSIAACFIRASDSPAVLNIGGFPGAVIEDISLKNCTFRGVGKPDRSRDARLPKMENVVVERASESKEGA